MPLRTRYFDLIEQVAAKHDLDPLLVEAVVVKESSGNADAFRFEPDFYNRYLKLSPGWEWARKKYANPRRISSSYGLMQVMFPVAVEDGYPKTDPPELMFLPEVALEYGCRRLRRLREWSEEAGPTVDPHQRLLASLAAYNGGKGSNLPGTQPLRNGSYARAVLQIYTQLKVEHGGQ